MEWRSWKVLKSEVGNPPFRLENLKMETFCQVETYCPLFQLHVNPQQKLDRNYWQNFHVIARFQPLCGICPWISSEWLAPEYIVRLLVWYNFDMGRSLESLVQRNPPSISTSSLRLLTHYCWSNSGPLGCHPLFKMSLWCLWCFVFGRQTGV